MIFTAPARWLLLPLVLVLGACAQHGAELSGPVPEPVAGQSCFERYRALAEQTRAAGVADQRHQRVASAPFLRSSRFYASFDARALSPEAYRQWLARQNRLAVEGLVLEWQRLTPGQQNALSEHWPTEPEALEAALLECGERLVSALADAPARQMGAGSEYQPWRRLVGGYPLLFAPFYRGVVAEHEELAERQQAFAEQNRAARTDRWAYFAAPAPSLTPTEALRKLSRQPRDELGLPKLEPEFRAELLAAFRPDWAVERQQDGSLADNDHPLRLSADGEGRIHRRSERPVVYTDLDYGRYRGQVVLRLSYHLWFDRRRPDGALDLLAGQYNGVSWRVHLLPTGGVIGYDKMHQCGCWYQFFPARGFDPRPDWPLTQEPVLFGRTLDPHRRHSLWLESNTHHLTGVAPVRTDHRSQPLRVESYDRLRALPTGENRRVSLFDEQGMVPGSERPERFVFWPMGIPNPGALRIRGTHAIAFIGRRHFDDPWLLRELGLE